MSREDILKGIIYDVSDPVEYQEIMKRYNASISFYKNDNERARGLLEVARIVWKNSYWMGNKRWLNEKDEWIERYLDGRECK